MIVVTRMDGPPLALNADLIERVESVPETVLVLIDGTTYAVCESLGEVVARVRDFRASVLVAAKAIELGGVAPWGPPPSVHLRALPGGED